MNLTDFSGDAWLEYPTSRSLCFPRGQLFACLHQPWFFDCPERYQLSRWCLDSHVILHHYQLPRLEAGCRAASTTTTMVAGELRHGH